MIDRALTILGWSAMAAMLVGMILVWLADYWAVLVVGALAWAVLLGVVKIAQNTGLVR